jgi:hypothetical protein
MKFCWNYWNCVFSLWLNVLDYHSFHPTGKSLYCFPVDLYHKRGNNIFNFIKMHFEKNCVRYFQVPELFKQTQRGWFINPLSSELDPICYLLALLAHDFLHVSRKRVKSLTLRLLMSYIYIYIYIYIYGAPISDVSRSHTTTQHSR